MACDSTAAGAVIFRDRAAFGGDVTFFQKKVTKDCRGCGPGPPRGTGRGHPRKTRGGGLYICSVS